MRRIEVFRGGAMRAARMGCVAAAVAVALLALASAAGASVSPFVWTGGAAGAEWSLAGNWQGGVAPLGSETVALEFPRLASCGGTCYASANDVENLNVESIALDDSDEYELGGKAINLGAGGLTATPAAGGSSALDIVELPVQLSAAQTWSISGRNEGLGENGVALLGTVSGEHALTYQVGDEGILYLVNETEVGTATISGAEASELDLGNGLVVTEFGAVNYFNGKPVSLSHISLTGVGFFGALSTNEADLFVGSGTEPSDGMVADSATFDGSSAVNFEIAGTGTKAGEAYSQLLAEGQVELGGATLSETVLSPPKGKGCAALQRGQTYTLVATTGQLLGTFGNAPEGGPEIYVGFEKACGQAPRPMRIEYHRGGAVQTVTGTVEAAAVEHEAAERKKEEEREQKTKKEEQERPAKEAEARKAEEEQRTREAVTRTGERTVAEQVQKRQEELAAAAAAAAKKHQEEETAAAAAASRKREEEALAKDGVLGVKENSSGPKHHASRAQLLARALKACKRQSPHKRALCEATAKRRYGARSKKGGHAKKG
jgi:hypothetical protein